MPRKRNATKKKSSQKKKKSSIKRVRMAGSKTVRSRRVRSVSRGPRGKKSFSAPLAMGSSFAVRGAKLGRPRGIQENSPLSKREFIGTLYGNTSFEVSYFGVNPANPALHPWGYEIAQKYDQWKFVRASLEFESQVSADTVGSIMMAFVPDWLDTIPSNSVELLQLAGARSQNPWIPKMSMPVLKTQINFVPRYYILPGAGDPPATADPHTYWGGRILVATEGFTDSFQIGKLFWNYEYLLINPVPPIPIAQYSGTWTSSANSENFNQLVRAGPDSGVTLLTASSSTDYLTLEFAGIPSTASMFIMTIQYDGYTTGGLNWSAINFTGANPLEISPFDYGAFTCVDGSDFTVVAYAFFQVTDFIVEITGLINTYNAGVGGSVTGMRLQVLPFSTGAELFVQRSQGCTFTCRDNRPPRVVPWKRLTVDRGFKTNLPLNAEADMQESGMEVLVQSQGGTRVKTTLFREDKKQQQYFKMEDSKFVPIPVGYARDLIDQGVKVFTKNGHQYADAKSLKDAGMIMLPNTKGMRQAWAEGSYIRMRKAISNGEPLNSDQLDQCDAYEALQAQKGRDRLAFTRKKNPDAKFNIPFSDSCDIMPAREMYIYVQTCKSRDWPIPDTSELKKGDLPTAPSDAKQRDAVVVREEHPSASPQVVVKPSSRSASIERGKKA